MPRIITTQDRVLAAETLFKSLNSATDNSSLYFSIGKILPWGTEAGDPASNDTAPPTPNDTYVEKYSVWNNVVHLKLLDSSNVSMGIRRYDWVAGVVYQEYRDDLDLFDSSLGLKPFYVLTDDLNVYKCITNNMGSPSIIKPTGKSSRIFSTSDKYQWKFMFDISDVQSQKFLTPQFIPVNIISGPDSSYQYDVQFSATPGSIDVIDVINGGSGYFTSPKVNIHGDGSGLNVVANVSSGTISSVSILNAGKNYTYLNLDIESGQVTKILINSPGSGYITPPTISIIGGNGSGAAATATIFNGTIRSINITNPGSGYITAPTIMFSGGNGTGASASAIISTPAKITPRFPPFGGHGSSAVDELGGFFVMVSSTFNANEYNFSIKNDFRKLALIRNPVLAANNKVATQTTLSQTYEFQLTGVLGLFSPDDVVTGSISGATGYVLDFSNSSNVLRLVQIEGTFFPGEILQSKLGANGSWLLNTSTAVGGSTNAIILDPNQSYIDYTGYTIYISSGTGAGQTRVITSSTLSGNVQTASVNSPWSTVPDATSVYAIAYVKYPDLVKNSGQIISLEYIEPFSRSLKETEKMLSIFEF